MKSLAILIKLQKTYVDDQRLVLARLQARHDEIRRQLAELEIEKIREQVAAQSSDAARQTYGAFLKGAVMRERALEKSLAAVTHEADAARDKLAALFEEQKRYELAEEARLDREAAAETRIEKARMDEVGSMSFWRKKKDEG